MKIFWTIFYFFWFISVAKADPITALVTAIVSGLGSIGTAIGGALATTGLVSFASIGAFLGSPIGALVLGVGLNLIVGALFKKNSGSSGGQGAVSIAGGTVNVKISEPERWINAGRFRQGGGALFGEFDVDGNFWFLIVHSDSQLESVVNYYFDDIELTLDGSGNVTNNDFCLDGDYNAYDGTGTRVTYFKIFTTTYSDGDPTPPAITEFKAAFPTLWTDDHKLVGTTYSVVKCKAIPAEHRYKIYKWRGSFGLGEPAIGIVGNWSKVYDPRTETYVFSKNPVLIWAWFRMHRYGRGKSFDSINWDMLAEQANICDEIVVGIDGSQPRYECGTAIIESKERNEAEQEILMSCDAQLVFDDDGKCWARVGYYYEPSVYLTRNRDIVAMESVEAQNGESETQGVIIKYIDPNSNYTEQPSAPWKNPLYYVEGETPKYLIISALAIQNHNQAMRIAKAIGGRSQAAHKLQPTTGLRGIKARQERIVNLSYDNTFSGDYEIVTPVEVDQTGIFCGFGVVPVDANRWTLLDGEENSQSVFSASSSSNAPTIPTGIIIQYDGSKLIFYYEALTRLDSRVEAQYKFNSETDDKYRSFSIDTINNIAFSGTVTANILYNVRYRTVTSSGKSSGWSSIYNIYTFIISNSATPVLTGTVGIAYSGFTVSGSGGTAPYSYDDVYSRLPTGLTISSSMGVVSGTPTVAGIYQNILLRVTDANLSRSYVDKFTITIS
jgi:hypothetical protein